MYKKQNFYSGQKLKASQLDVMEDGIIQAQEDARNICYEGYAYDPIEWDGVIGSREHIDISSLDGADPGFVYLVKLNDTILTREDCINSIAVIHGTDREDNATIGENQVSSEAEIQESGMIAVLNFLMVVIDANKASAMLKINIPTTGIYGICSPKEGVYVKSFSKAIIKKIDEKFLPELASGANMEKGTGASATQQLPDGVADGFDFTGKNPNAEAIDNTLSAVQPYGATGEFAAAFGGKASAQGRRAFACGTTTIAKGKYSFAAGENTAALGNSSSAEGMQTTSVGYAAHAQNGLTVAYGDSSHAQNYITKAIGDYSTATGIETVAAGIASFTSGRGTVATVDSQMVVGRYNNESKALFVVGNGTGANTRHTAFAVYEDGTIWASKAPTENNHVVRLGDLPAAIDSKMDNMGLKQTGGISVSQKQANASADSSAAFNQGKATNVLTFAAGTNTEASGYGATAFGVNTVSKNAYGFTTGEGTQTGRDCQTVVGKYNLGTQGLFEVGCGSGEADRQNGFAVTADGYIIIKRPGTNEYYYLSKLFDNLNAWVDAAKI